MLGDIKRYFLSREGLISLQDLANHFGVEQDQMYFMLSHWIRKGRLVKYQNNSCGSSSGGCNGCSSAQAEYYAWEKPSIDKIASISL